MSLMAHISRRYRRDRLVAGDALASRPDVKRGGNDDNDKLDSCVHVPARSGIIDTIIISLRSNQPYVCSPLPPVSPLPPSLLLAAYSLSSYLAIFPTQFQNYFLAIFCIIILSKLIILTDPLTFRKSRYLSVYICKANRICYEVFKFPVTRKRNGAFRIE